MCAPGDRYFSTILWVYKGALNFFGVVMAAKTWNCADGVGEVRFALVTVGRVYNISCVFVLEYRIRKTHGVVINECQLTA